MDTASPRIARLPTRHASSLPRRASERHRADPPLEGVQIATRAFRGSSQRPHSDLRPPGQERVSIPTIVSARDRELAPSGLGLRGSVQALRHPDHGVCPSHLAVTSLRLPRSTVRDLPGTNPNAIDLAHTLAAPGPDHWLGCDALGRDILARLMWGARISLGVSSVVIALSLTADALLVLLQRALTPWARRTAL